MRQGIIKLSNLNKRLLLFVISIKGILKAIIIFLILVGLYIEVVAYADENVRIGNKRTIDKKQSDTGEANSKPQNFNAWLNEGINKLQDLADQHYLPLNVAVVESMSEKGDFRLKKIDTKVFNEMGMLRLIDDDALGFSQLFNKALIKRIKKTERGAERSVQILFGLSNADLALHVPDDKQSHWSLRYDNGKSIEIVSDTGRPKLAKEMKDSQEVTLIYDWILSSLGYNGVILDKKGKYYLVAGLQRLLKPGGQAVVLGESAKVNLVNKDYRNGTALLKVIKSSGPFAILKLTFQKPAKPAPRVGDKISLSM
ncbi:MAG: hypothetical protein R3B45_06710 [Bdellovibrionota bacterium]